MTLRIDRSSGLVALLIAVGFCVPASAQSTLSRGTSFDNLGISLGRPPGDMVSAGLARAQESADTARSQVLSPQITETEPRTSIRSEFLVKAVKLLMDQFESAALFLGNRWLARAGLVPLLPASMFFPSADTADSSDSADSDSSTDDDRDGRGSQRKARQR